MLIKGGDVTAFGSVTKSAGVGKIIRRGLTPMLFAEDVIDLTTHECVALVNEAVFAATRSTGRNEAA